MRKLAKRIAGALLVLVLVLGMVPGTVRTAEAAMTEGDYQYSVSNGAATITNYSGAGDDVTIPNTLGGYPVTSIGGYAFYWCKSLTSVTIGNGVTSIGSYAFYCCTNLASITIPDSVTSIGSYAFCNCRNLTSVTIPDSVTGIGTMAFNNCSSLTNISVSAGNTAYVSQNGVLFTKDMAVLVSYPGGKAGAYAIPDSVTSIGNYTFEDCRSLTSVTIPDSVESIGYNAFYNCSSLTSVTIGNGVTNIWDCAFYGCDSLTSVTIPDSVTYIGSYAFCNCRNLTSVTIPDSVTEIGTMAFNSCRSLTSVTIPDSVTRIGGDAFSWCERLTSVTIPDSVTSIDGGAFGECSSLTSVTVGNGVTRIRDYAFFNCTNLTSVTFAGCAPSIDEDAFSGVTATAYYPAGDATWTQSILHNYGGRLTWKPYTNADLNANLNAHTLYSETVIADSNNLRLDLSDARCDIDLGNVSGPSIDILGHKFNLLEFGGNLDLDIGKTGASISCKIDNEKKTLRVILGYDDDAKAELQNGNKFNEEYAELKELYRYIKTGKYTDWNGYQRLRISKLSKLLGEDGNLGVKAKIKVTGYLEFSYETGEMIPTESGIIVAGEVGVTFTYQPNIFYITTGLKGSADAAVSIACEQNGKIKFNSLSTNFKLTVKVGVGVGSKALKLYGEGGLQGELAVDLSSDFVNSADYKVSLTGSLYIEAKAVLFTYKKTWDFYKKDLLDKTVNLRGAKLRGELVSEGTYGEIERKYSYTAVQTTENAAKNMLKSRRAASAGTDVFSQENIYPYSMPVYLKLDDGRTMLIWVGDDGTKSDHNRTSILYSICTDHVWSQPAVLQDSGTYNDMPCACTDGEKIYLVWQRANEAYGEELTLEEAVAKIDLYYSVFDGDAFSEPVCITDDGNAIYEDTMSICSAGSTQTVSWRQNDENRVFDEVGNDALYYQLCRDGIWEEPVLVTSCADMISEQVCTVEDGATILYYVVSGDTDTLYRYDSASRETRQIATGSTVSSLSVVDGQVYYLCDEYLYTYAYEPALVADMQLNNYQIVSDGGYTTLLTLRTSGYKNALYISEKEDGAEEFSDLSLFADYDSYIRNYSAIMGINGLTTVAVNSVEVNEENLGSDVSIYGSADLFVTEKEDYVDLCLHYVACDPEAVVPSAEIPFDYQVSNEGNVSLDAFTAELYNESGALIASERVECALYPGESGMFTIGYRLPEQIKRQEITLKLVVENENDQRNNESTTTIGLADIQFADLSVYPSEGQKAVLTGYVENTGFDTAEDVTVHIYRLHDSEKVEIGECSLSIVEASGKTAFSAELPGDMFMTDNSDVMNSVYLSVSTSSEESKLSNNDDKLVYDTLATGTYDSMTYSLYNNGELYFEGNGTLHYYDDDSNPVHIYEGKITSVKLGPTITCEHSYGEYQVRPTDDSQQTNEIIHICKMCLHEEKAGSSCLGDLDGDGETTDADAIYLLMHTFFPEDYPVSGDCDYDGDGEVTDADAIYLLMYTFFPEDYPVDNKRENA